MPRLSVGQEISILCKVQPGPFSVELLVTIEGVDGPISGFVRSEELKDGPDGRPRVRGVVRSVGKDFVEAWVRGSFFTTNGLTNVRPEIATAA
jgi:hypothetical protein